MVNRYDFRSLTEIHFLTGKEIPPKIERSSLRTVQRERDRGPDDNDPKKELKPRTAIVSAEDQEGQNEPKKSETKAKIAHVPRRPGNRSTNRQHDRESQGA